MNSRIWLELGLKEMRIKPLVAAICVIGFGYTPFCVQAVGESECELHLSPEDAQRNLFFESLFHFEIATAGSTFVGSMLPGIDTYSSSEKVRSVKAAVSEEVGTIVSNSRVTAYDHTFGRVPPSITVHSSRGTIDLFLVYSVVDRTFYLENVEGNAVIEFSFGTPNSSESLPTIWRIGSEPTRLPKSDLERHLTNIRLVATERLSSDWQVEDDSILSKAFRNLESNINFLRSRIGQFHKILKILETENEIGDDRTMVFIEDDQGYTKTPIVFRTNYPGTAEQLGRISRSGRYSYKFTDLQDSLRKVGFSCSEIERLQPGNHFNPEYPVVHGGEGNY